jgi:phenylpropionate dioxygenase-like ring-hydroxylating dioxygenase large terminal subunit
MYFRGNLSVFPDTCPHQGASLSQGWVTPRGHVRCPYHGFAFDAQGRFQGIPEDGSASSPYVYAQCGKRTVSSSEVWSDRLFRFDQDVFLARDNASREMPYYPPEHFNRSFTRIQGHRLMNHPAQMITENVLDMLHISYVHSFGNRDAPLPCNVTFRELSSTSGRSTFVYRPNAWTLSRRVGGADDVVVENEYYLPSTTITRVKAGGLTKTVMTRATSISSDTTVLYWTVYRDFWMSPTVPGVTWLGDVVMTMMMQKTLDEDVAILRHVTHLPDAILTTPFDVTIQRFRRARRGIETKEVC